MKPTSSLVEENAKFRIFFEQGSNFAGLMSLDGTLIEANRLSLDACGYTREQVIGKKFWDCPWWSPSVDLVRMIRQGTIVAASGETFRAESKYFIADGSQRYVSFALTPVRDETRRVIFVAPTGTDITDRKRAEEVNAHYAAIVASSDDAIISKDLNGIITSWNAAATRLFGYTADEAIGRSITLLIPDDRLNEEPGIIGRIRNGERIEHFETIRRRKDGSMIEISLVVSPILDDKGKVVGASKIARDITEKRRTERALLEADRQKNEFLAILAHELRNPLAPIRNALNILHINGGAGNFKRLQEMMARQVGHLERLVDDLLEISRITTGKIDLRRENLSIEKVISNAVETSRPLIDGRKHKLEISLPVEPLFVDGDLVRLSQVVSNLLNNAAKYCPDEGIIKLTVSRAGDQVQISISDNGIGISPEMLPLVLDMFMQAEGARRHSQDGLGIGLALVKRLVEMHRGTVEARSEGEGMGSEFIIRLPLSTISIDQSIVEAEASGSSLRHRVLVVDDNQDAADSLAMLLELMGSDVQTANDGMSALKAFDTFRPSVVLLDLGMPDITGYEVAKRMRSMPQFNGVRLVALTGWGQEEDRQRTLEAGFHHHLVKPVDIEDLQGLLAEGK